MDIKDIISFLKYNTKFNVDEITSIKKAQGLSNENYKVSFNNGEKLFVRICSHEYLYTDRKNELEIINMAWQIKLTIKPYYFSIKSGDMILPWINGRIPLKSDFSSDAFMKKLCSKLKKFHNLSCKNTFDPFLHIQNQIDLCRSKNLVLPFYLDKLIKKLNKLEQSLSTNINIGLCHNDFNYSNIIISNDELYFIDFEYSAMGDVYWDLSTLSWFLTIDERKKLLTCYFGCYREEDYKKLMDYLYVVKLSNALWSLLRSEDSNGDYDYLKGAFIVFEDLIKNIYEM